MDRLRPNRQIGEEAAAWFVEINEAEPDSATRRRFDAWLRASPEHVRAYLELLPVWEQGVQLDIPGVENAEALVVWAKAGSTEVHPLGRLERLDRARSSARARMPHRALAACAALLCIAAGIGGWMLLARGATYETAISERRSIALEDGSRVELNSRSGIRVRFSEGARDIELLEGQALFQVARDPKRPFVVRSGSTRVRAVGTQFDMYRKRDGTVVTVLEGRVAVAEGVRMLELGTRRVEGLQPIVLSAGEQMVMKPAAHPERKRADLAVATAWTRQRLVFSRASLVEVAEEFNRYNARQLVISDPSLTSFRMSGTFSSAEPDSLIRFLRAQPGIEVNDAGERISISAR